MPGHQDQKHAPGKGKDGLLSAHQVDRDEYCGYKLVDDEPRHFLPNIGICGQRGQEPEDAEEEKEFLFVPWNRCQVVSPYL